MATRHALRYRVVVESDGTRRLICGARRCGEPIVGAWHGITGWRGGVHRSDFEARRYVCSLRPDNLGHADRIAEVPA